MKDKIKIAVLNHLGLTEDEINTTSRKGELVYARQLIMFFMHKINYTFTDCSREFNKTHATAIHACSKLSFLYDIEKQIKSDIDKIDSDIKLLIKNNYSDNLYIDNSGNKMYIFNESEFLNAVRNLPITKNVLCY